MVALIGANSLASPRSAAIVDDLLAQNLNIVENKFESLLKEAKCRPEFSAWNLPPGEFAATKNARSHKLYPANWLWA